VRSDIEWAKKIRETAKDGRKTWRPSRKKIWEERGKKTPLARMLIRKKGGGGLIGPQTKRPTVLPRGKLSAASPKEEKEKGVEDYSERSAAPV